jgi:hypothetical protein
MNKHADTQFASIFSFLKKVQRRILHDLIYDKDFLDSKELNKTCKSRRYS